MSAHTLGPWFVDRNHAGNIMGVASPKRRHDLEFVAECQDEANARLIAAAPELLHACKFVLECTSGGDFTMNGPNGLRTVGLGWFLKKIIAKAEGKT